MTRSRKQHKKVLLLKHETEFNVDAEPIPSADAILCEDPMFTPDITVLERNNVRPNFSKEKHSTGRKLAKIEFTVEIRSNNKLTGLEADLPQFGKCLIPCGVTATYGTAADTRGPFPTDDHVNPVSWADGDNNYAGTQVVNLLIRCTLGGASGTAKLEVISDAPDVIPDTAEAVVTTGTDFELNGTDLTVTPTFTGNLVAGQSWLITVLPTKFIEIVPTSEEENHVSATLYLYMDGNLHIMTGAFGTATFDGTVNGYGKAKFTFIGQYYPQTAAALPTPTFEKSKPAQIELSRLLVDGFPATVSKFTTDLGVVVQPRLDSRGSDGYNGTYIDDRKIKGGIDPEATLASDENFWTKLSTAKGMPLTYRFGSVPGNIVNMVAASVQYTGLTYQNRENIQTYDAGLNFTEVVNGDDELRIIIA